MAGQALGWGGEAARIGLWLIGLALAANEVRGLILAAPVMWAMYEAGGTPMAIWLGACSLAGIALSVAVPWWLARRLVRAVR